MRVYDNSRRRVDVDVACAVCAKAFTVRRCDLRRGKRFCSNDCRLAGLNRLPKWNVGRRTPRLTAKGYVRVWDGERLVMEHRFAMERHLGRALTASERVHHINGDRTDNRIENLRLYASQSEHLRAHHLPISPGT